MPEETLIMVRVEKTLIDKVIKKLNANPTIPAVYIVDQALRNYIEE